MSEWFYDFTSHLTWDKKKLRNKLVGRHLRGGGEGKDGMGEGDL